MKHKNIITNGSILAIPLHFNMGYCYAKIIFSAEIFNLSFSLSTLKVFNYRSKTVFSNVDLAHLDLITNPLLPLGLPNKNFNKRWAVVRESLLCEDDFIATDYKNAPQSFYLNIDNEEVCIKKWGLVRNFNINESYNFHLTFKQCSHLDLFLYLSPDLIETRVTMEFLRISGNKIEDYYDLKTDWKSRLIHNTMKNIPIYSEISQNIRGRALLNDI